MEGSEKTAKKYSRRKDIIFRNTLDEDYLPFQSVKPSMKEYTQEELKKKDAPDIGNYSEANVMRTFKGKAAPIFNKDKLVYNKKTHEWYKVLDLKTDDQYNPTWASIMKKDGVDAIEISKPEEFDEFKNSLKIFINITKDGDDTMTIEVNPKIYEKFETAFEGPFEGAGAALMG